MRGDGRRIRAGGEDAPNGHPAAQWLAQALGAGAWRRPEGTAHPRDPFRDEEGFSTVGVVIALLITLSLVFTGAQVYQVQSASAEIQEVADVTALAAENVVAEFYLVACLCDAVVLSLTLTGIAALGMGVAALCTPVTAAAGKTLIEAGERVLKARDEFAQKAAAGLDKLQKALPFLAAAAAVRVSGANSGAGYGSYFGFAVLAPFEGEEVSAGTLGSADSLIDKVEESRDDLEKAGEEAEKAAEEARAAKERAFQADCGANPGYCLYERAATLAGLSGRSNPLFKSVDTWSFSAALQRAKAYYPRRLSQEAPTGSSVDEQANSALRKRFYAYAVEAVGKGYVRESDDSFDADFPLLPKNTSEMKGTRLYTETVYPITMGDDDLPQMHAWSGCPRAAGAMGSGSLAQRDAGTFGLCPECRFASSSLGKVAAASSSIENGFEFHYRIVAEEAEKYEKAKGEYNERARKVKDTAGSLFDEALDALRQMASQRITVAPPGRIGAVAIVASTQPRAASANFASRFVGDAGMLGTRVAISASTLVSDSPEQGRTVIASALDGVREQTGSRLAGVLDGVMDLWSTALFAYADGQERIGQGLDNLTSKLPLRSESGLGTWGSKRFKDLMETLGLQPAELDAPKPVLVNTGHVLEADSSSAFSARLLSVKRAAAGLTGGDVLSGTVNAIERGALERIESFDGEITLAEIELFGAGGPKLPITIALPEAARESSIDLVTAAADALRGIAGSVTGVRQWR